MRICVCIFVLSTLSISM